MGRSFREGRLLQMKAALSAFAASAVLLAGLAGADAALAQKQGGTLRVYHRDSPASMSIHEEGTVGVIMPMMGVFNNLVIFDQHVPQNSMQSIVPELATSWAWSEDGTELSFKLRDGVKWHDGKPFTAEDVKCTFDLLTNQGKRSSASIIARPGGSMSPRRRPVASMRPLFI
jgi:peptide/nickel transport system substrate-binding protein